jgi:hypothetical protein
MKYLVAVSLWIAPSAFGANDVASDIARIHDKVTGQGERKPSSACLSGDEVRFVDAMNVKDYTQCSSAELRAIKGVLRKVVDVSVSGLSSGESVSIVSAAGYLGAARSTLVLLKQEGL